jgi:N-acetyl sugar amidotransferase
VAERKGVAIDWSARETELLRLLDLHRGKHKPYDCIVPGSGGKDSCYAAHVLKHKYGMTPLLVTWEPTMPTDYGRANYESWVKSCGGNAYLHSHGIAHRILTRLSVRNLLHPFQTFIYGQKGLAPKVALEYNVPLVFYGESEAEYGNPIAETATSLRDKSYWAADPRSCVLCGVEYEELIRKHGFSEADLAPYLPANPEALGKSDIQVHYLGYYLKWRPQDAYYYAVENCGFRARPKKTDGTYSQYNSIDDKIDDLHYYTTHIKFGLGRASYDASQEIRNGEITREQGLQMVARYDGEYPSTYMDEVLDYLGMSVVEFDELCDRFRPPHLWGETVGLGRERWFLKHKAK